MLFAGTIKICGFEIAFVLKQSTRTSPGEVFDVSAVLVVVLGEDSIESQLPCFLASRLTLR